MEGYLLEAIKSVLQRAALARHSGEAAEAERLYKEAAAEAQAKDDLMRAEALMGVAEGRRDRGDLTSASIHYAEAITILRGVGALPQLASALRQAADVRSLLREFAVAGAHIEECVRLYEVLVTTGGAESLDLANALRTSALNDERRAYQSWQRARKLYTERDISAGAAECQEHLGSLKHHNLSTTHQGEHAA